MFDGLHRKGRIIARILKQKNIPPYAYRLDTRPPAVIRGIGFQPWDHQGRVTIIEHIKNRSLSGPNRGMQVKEHSQWVSTGSYGMLKRLGNPPEN